METKKPKGNCKKWTWVQVACSVLFIGFQGIAPVISGGTLVLNEYPAIERVGSSLCDTVYVWNNTFCGDVTINKPLVVQGKRREATIMDGGGSGSYIYIGTDNGAIQGFTVRNCFQGLSDYKDQFGIDKDADIPIEVVQNVIQ